ncbi:UPF0029-domain-containing protein [Rhodotorula sp. JG-1b]|nr:UPF0029-domain-containing protein [Rhodotorula sp. JG-1b]
MADALGDSLGLALILSALEASSDANAHDIADELQSLAAIYDSPDQQPALAAYTKPSRPRVPSPPAEWSPSSSASNPLRLVVSTTLASPRDDIPLHVLVSLPKGYPADEPPLLQLQDRYLSSFAVSDALFGAVLRTFMHDPEAVSDGTTPPGIEWTGGVCLFEGVEYVREVCGQWVADREKELAQAERARTDAAAADASEKRDRQREAAAAAAAPRRGEGEGSAPVANKNQNGHASKPAAVPCPTIVSSDPIIDRQSVFVGHTAKVESLEEVEAVMDSLLSNSKIARATHNISAYQFTTASGTRHADNDDDGETAAGSRLAHLLTLLDVPNVMVVVTRWYGGVHLGPDRFKLINQAARDALTDAGFLPSADEGKDKKSSKSSSRKK